MMIIRKLLKQNSILFPILSNDPAPRLIRDVGRQNWRLILLNFASNLTDTLTEGATLAILFLAVQILTATSGAPFNWQSNPLLNWSPSLAQTLNNLDPKVLFTILLLVAVLLQALQSIVRFLNQLSVGYFAARCRTTVTEKIHQQILSLSFSCASSFKIGDLVDYSLNGPEAIRVYVEQTSQLIANILLSLGYLIFLIAISPALLVAAGLIGSVIAIIQKTLLPRLKLGSTNVSTLNARTAGLISENLQALRLLHSTGQLGHANQNLHELLVELKFEMERQARRLAIVSPVSNFLPTAAIAIMAAFAVLFIGSRSTGILPSLVTFVLALQRLNIRLSGIASNQNLLSNNSGNFSRLNYILSHQGKSFIREGGVPFVGLKSEIEFRSVFLQYNSNSCYTLSDINFSIPRGKTIALVGFSGAGKSSVADLLSGLYKTTSGEILVDGLNLDAIQMRSWQQRLGVVSQDTFLFNASIAENIAFGLETVSADQIRAACASAQASGFIETLPQQYDTIIGERGYRLSGGQRQRLSLARAIIREPDLLILDEATSALDSHSERLVQQAIEQFEQTHTVLVIAHRLSTIAKADQIHFMESGKIIENGTHDELISLRGKYANLWDQQVSFSRENLTSSLTSDV